ncbi:MAG: HmuY family protein [Bacteroidota bacterium]
MYLKNSWFYLYAVLLFLVSCRKQEIPIKPLDRGDIITNSVDMNADYRQQLFFSLSANTVVAGNLKTAWDIAFECGAAGFHLRINTAKAMCVANTSQTTFNLVNDTSNFSVRRQYDSPTGNEDSTAFGNWQTSKPVFIVDRGYNETGTPQGFRKIQILGVSANDYTIKLANVDGSNELTLTLPKSPDKNYVQFSFSSNSLVQIEPARDNYDLLFSQYTHIYSNPFSTYLVAGVLANPYKVMIAPVFDKAFRDIVLQDTITHPFSRLHNTIGYYWKTYDFQSASYVINFNMSYIIKDVNGFYYKLHFIDFYNSLGVKGFPKFEFKKL